MMTSNKHDGTIPNILATAQHGFSPFSFPIPVVALSSALF
jgi:hypothetical protein